MSPRLRVLRLAGRACGLAALALGAVLLGNTLRAVPVARPALPPLPGEAVDGARIAGHLAAALRWPTISHEDAAGDDPGALAGLQATLQASYPALHAALTREVVGAAALLYRWEGRDPALEPVLLAAHQDVVPVEPGTEGRWTHAPFDGVIEGGHVWGRGAIDDKGSLVALLEAVEHLVAQGFRPRRTVLLALGCDEEVGGAHGAREIAATLAARGVHLAWALDEGGAVTQGIVPDVAAPVAVVGVAEKGMLTVELTVRMPTGHSSMPPAQTSIGVLAAAVDRLQRAPMPARMTWVTRRMFDTIAPEMPFGRRLALANLWLFEPLVVSLLARSPATDATIRTTTAPTLFHAGVKENVLPSEARATINFRVLPGDTTEGVLAHVREAIHDERVEITPSPRSRAEPTTPSPVDSEGYLRIEAAVRRAFPSALVVPSITVGATDVRHYAALAGGTYRFAPFVFGKDEMSTLHGTNERIAVDQLPTAVRFYEDVIREGQ